MKTKLSIPQKQKKPFIDRHSAASRDKRNKSYLSISPDVQQKIIIESKVYQKAVNINKKP